ncbi:MAG: TlpA family protein disulfide reductase, partial [Desulfobacterales bacterium]|nr:TlpA family protein disulfide reductase [Desulfobacterales bacterium]
MRRIIILIVCLAVFLPAFSKQVQIVKNKDAFRVNLSRVDNEKSGMFNGFYFEKDLVSKAIEKFPVKLPDPFPADAELGYFYGGPIYAIKQKMAGQSKIKLTVDTNANFDLTDDAVLELSHVEEPEEASIIKFARHFSEPMPRTEWLPYIIWYSESMDRNDLLREDVYIQANYKFSGEFQIGNQAYILDLIDGDSRGRFIREKLSNVFVHFKEKEDQKPSKGGRLFELFQMEDNLYEIKEFAEDGSWIDFIKSPLPTAALGKPAPDMELTDTDGHKFKLSDYRGKLLLLDFWPSWCKPCVAQFTEIKEILQNYKDQSLAVIGINIDEAARLEQARKVIADHQLPWPHVMDGKGQFIPVYQVYGRLPERMNSFPAYVVIDREGIARYASNDFKKMARFLQAHFSGNTEGTHTLFIPLADASTKPATQPARIDFSVERIQQYLELNKVTFPENLPKETRLGLMSNGTLLSSSPGSSADSVSILIDSDRDFDLTNNEAQEIPVVEKPNPEKTDAKNIQIIITYESSARSFYTYSFFATPVQNSGSSDVLFFGFEQTFSGSFYEGDQEYQIEITDPTPDLLFTKEDQLTPDILKLKIKKDNKWELVYQGTQNIPIGDHLYRIHFVSDDGNLIEL